MSSLLRITFAVMQKPCQGNFGKFQESGESRFGGSEKYRYFLKIPKWLHKLFRDYKRGQLVSYFLNNVAKTCLYSLKLSENIEIENIFQSKAFFHLSSNHYPICLNAFNSEPAYLLTFMINGMTFRSLDGMQLPVSDRYQLPPGHWQAKRSWIY